MLKFSNGMMVDFSGAKPDTRVVQKSPIKEENFGVCKKHAHDIAFLVSQTAHHS